MIKHIIKIIFLSLVLFLSSCTTMLYTEIDVLRPAKVIFETDDRNLLILNNTIAQPHNYGHTTQLIGEKKKNVSVNTDSLAIFCLSVLNQEFEKTEFFDRVDLHLNTVKQSNFFDQKAPTWDSIVHLSKYYGSNVILSLNQIKVTDNILEYYNEEFGMYYAVLEANYETVWSLIDPESQKTSTFLIRDTIFWDNESSNRKRAINSLPRRYDALIDGALYVGQNSINKFVPYWDKEKRYFFSTKNKHLAQGMDSIYVKNWSAAIDIWTKNLPKSNNSLKAYFYHNLANAYELSGDIAKSIEYNNKSLEVLTQLFSVNYKHFETISEYNEALLKRKKEIELINKQLGVK